MARLHVHAYLLDDDGERPIVTLRDVEIDTETAGYPLACAELLYAAIAEIRDEIRHQATQLEIERQPKEQTA